MPKDRFGREIDYLRISVIDHCNLRCVYCMPLRGLTFIPSPELLTADEIETVARAALSLGFRKFRLTGGEPTLRPDIVEIVGRIAALDGVARRGHDHERHPAARAWPGPWRRRACAGSTSTWTPSTPSA